MNNRIMNTDIYHHNNMTVKFCHDNILDLLKTNYVES